MDLSKFLNTLYSSCGKTTKLNFLLEIFDNVIDENNENPMDKYQPNTLNKIFNGSTKISRITAIKIKTLFNKDKFIDYLSTFSDQTIEKIILDFNILDYNIDKASPYESITELFEQIIINISEGIFNTTYVNSNINHTYNLFTCKNIYFNNDELYINNKLIDKIKVKTMTNDKFFIKTLINLYNEKSNINPCNYENINTLPSQHLKHLQMHMENFFLSIKDLILDNFTNGNDQFELLLNEIHSGLIEILSNNSFSKFQKFQLLMEKVIYIPFEKSAISNIKGLIGNNEKKAIILYLIEERRITL